MATESQPEPSTEGRGARAFLRKAFSFPALMGGLLVAEVFAFTHVTRPDPDTWWHIRVGEDILSTGTWPTVDIYSFTASGTDWMAYEWLGEVLLAWAARPAGLFSLHVALGVVSALLILLLYYYGYLASGNSKAAFGACAILTPVVAIGFTPRPQLPGYIFLLITLIFLERFRQGRQKHLWVLPVIFLIWVNTHGTFVFGGAALGLYWLAGLFSFQKGSLTAKKWRPEQRRHLLVIALLCIIASTVTPYGTRIAAYPLQMATTQSVNINNIIEWQPMPFDLAFGKMFLGVVLLFLLGAVLVPQNYRLEALGLFLVALYSALVHRRFIVFFGLVFAPLLAKLLSHWVAPYQPEIDKPALNALLLAILAGILIATLPSAAALETRADELYPRGAVDYLREHPVGGRVFNHYGWGGYLIWSLYPQHRVFIDGRADLYEYTGVLPDYFAVTRLEPDAVSLLRAYNVSACLIEREAPLGTLLAALPEWEVVYKDELSRLFVHK